MAYHSRWTELNAKAAGMQIFVDADAFPRALKEILFRAVERVRVPLILVANQTMRLPDSDLISIRIVADGPDMADDSIVDWLEPGDLVVTADVPLADRIVEKGGYALDPRGDFYTEANVKQRLATRNLMDELRGTGLVTGGPPTFNQKDAQSFANQLDRFLTKHCRD